MVTTLGHAKARAQHLFQASDYAGALHLYEQILAAVPSDHHVRVKIADVLAKTGLTHEAADIYSVVGVHSVRAGNPLLAIVAHAALQALGQSADELLKLLAQSYASDSPRLGQLAARPAPPDAQTPVAIPASAAGPFDELATSARLRALELPVADGFSQHIRPLPFLSQLGPDAFLAVLRLLAVRRYGDRDVVVRQGDAGTALYLIASGELKVVATDATGVPREIAHLYENSMFGEMALIADQPRAASVVVVGQADVVEVSKASIDGLCAVLPSMRETLAHFTRERLMKNLLGSSPLFVPFTKDQQAELLKRFEGHEVAAGTELIHQGEAGRGLFVVLSGQLEVVNQSPASPVVRLAVLGPGDIFGEMSLLDNQPTAASVRTLAPTSVLFLPRVFFQRLAEAIPEVRAYFESVASQRARDNSMNLGRRALPDEPMEIDITDVILL